MNLAKTLRSLRPKLLAYMILVIIVKTLASFSFPFLSMFIWKMPKQTRETNTEGRGGKQ